MDINKKYTDYFGFDLGDGECALAWVRPDKRVEPQVIELRGKKNIISAIGKHPQKGILIGEEACYGAGMEWLDTRFKSRYLIDEAASGARIEQFARAVLDALIADGRIGDIEKTYFFIGCPSGWSDEVRRQYRRRFVSAGMVNCDVISESRAAFMFARESGELEVSEELLIRPTLIIDAGSSTTDFTYVADLNERSLQASDFGEVALGGGLIDRLVLAHNLERSSKAQEIKSILKKYRVYEARCEFEARRVKEMYFTQQKNGGDMVCESAVKLYADHTPITLEVSLNDEDMKTILNKPVDELGGRSFNSAYRESLLRAKAMLKEAPPENILLTGGASRMPLIMDICREVFPQAQVMRGLEPEFAIARGLCYALQIERKVKSFSGAVQDLIRSDDMEKLVMKHLPDLYFSFSEMLTSQLTDDIMPECFARWRSGEIRTINELSEEISNTIRTQAENGQLQKYLRPAVREWIEKMQPDIEVLTDPICDKYDLPRTSMRLQIGEVDHPGSIKIDSDKLFRTQELGAIIDVIVGVIAAMLLGGGGLALLMSGPAGLIMGFVIGIIAAVIGTKAAEQLIYKSDVPAWIRKAFLPGILKKMFALQRSSFLKSIYSQLMKEVNPPTEAVTNTVNTIAHAIEGELEQMMKRAALLIH